MADFEVIPSIDLLGGQGVRLKQGRYDEATVYEPDPAVAARRFAAHGIRRFHVVDLDAARSGERVNADAVREIVAAMGPIPVQLGGGVRSLEDVESAFDLGIDRVVIGTAALRNPPLVREAAKRHPQKVVVGIDARAGRVAVEGWVETSETTAADLALRFEDVGVAAVVYTDIERDGLLGGPNFDATAELADAIEIPVILSGGVSCQDDLVRAAELLPRGVTGAIIGRALYTGDVELGATLEAVACC